MIAVAFLSESVSLVAALFVVVAGFALNRSAEHSRWLRQTRLQLYADFLEQARLFDRNATRMATWWRQSAHPDERIAEMEKHQAVIGDLYERIRIVGSADSAAAAELAVGTMRTMVYVDEYEHGALAFVEAKPAFKEQLEVFAAGVRAELRADGMWRSRVRKPSISSRTQARELGTTRAD